MGPDEKLALMSGQVEPHNFLVGAAGLEPATTCLEGRCSIHLSYAPVQ